MGTMGEALSQVGGGEAWAQFENEGDTLTGEIMGMTIRQATYEGKALESLAGKAKMELVVTLRVSPPEGDDDGMRLVAIKLWGVNASALKDAVKDLGRDGDIGDMMHVEYLGKRKPPYPAAPTHTFRYRLKAGAPKQADSWATAPNADYSDNTPF